MFPEQKERPCCQGWNARSDALWWFKEGNEEAHCDPLKLLRKPGEEIWNYHKRDLMRNGGLTPHPVGSLMVTNSQALSFICPRWHYTQQHRAPGSSGSLCELLHGISKSIWRELCPHVLIPYCICLLWPHSNSNKQEKYLFAGLLFSHFNWKLIGAGAMQLPADSCSSTQLYREITALGET